MKKITILLCFLITVSISHATWETSNQLIDRLNAERANITSENPTGRPNDSLYNIKYPTDALSIAIGKGSDFYTAIEQLKISYYRQSLTTLYIQGDNDYCDTNNVISLENLDFPHLTSIANFSTPNLLLDTIIVAKVPALREILADYSIEHYHGTSVPLSQKPVNLLNLISGNYNLQTVRLFNVKEVDTTGCQLSQIGPKEYTISHNNNVIAIQDMTLDNSYVPSAEEVQRVLALRYTFTLFSSQELNTCARVIQFLQSYPTFCPHTINVNVESQESFDQLVTELSNTEMRKRSLQSLMLLKTTSFSGPFYVRHMNFPNLKNLTISNIQNFLLESLYSPNSHNLLPRLIIMRISYPNINTNQGSVDVQRLLDHYPTLKTLGLNKVNSITLPPRLKEQYDSRTEGTGNTSITIVDRRGSFTLRCDWQSISPSAEVVPLYNGDVGETLQALGVNGFGAKSRFGSPYTVVTTANSLQVAAQAGTRQDDWFYLRKFFNAEATRELQGKKITVRFNVKGTGTLHAFWLCAPENNAVNGTDFTDSSSTGRLDEGRKSFVLSDTLQEVTLELDVATLPSGYSKQLMFEMHTVGSNSLEIQNLSIDYKELVGGTLQPLGCGLDAKSRFGSPYTVAATANSVTVKAEEGITRSDDWFYFRKFFNATETEQLQGKKITVKFNIKGNGTLHAFWLCACDGNSVAESGTDFTDSSPTGREEVGRKSVELNDTLQEVTLELDVATLPSNYDKKLMFVMHTVGSTSLEIQGMNIATR